MSNFTLDIAYFLASSMVVCSFMLLYQSRLSSMMNVFIVQSIILACSICWQAAVQHVPSLYVSAGIAFIVKGIVIPIALKRIMKKLKIHRQIETVVGIGPTLLAGVALSALAVVVMSPVTTHTASFTRDDLSFALAVILMGLLLIISRQNAVSQIIGFMSLENGLVLAATGAKGMPLVVEISVAFSVLILFFVFGAYMSRIREQFDTVNISALDDFQKFGREPSND